MGSTKKRARTRLDDVFSDEETAGEPFFAEGGPDPTQGEGREAREPDEPSRSGPIPDLIRRAMAAGFSGFFSTEEAIRRALGDTVPKDWIDFMSAQSERTRNEMIQRFSREMAEVAARVDVAELFEKLLAGRTIEVQASIRLGDREPARDGADDRPRTHVAAKARLDSEEPE